MLDQPCGHRRRPAVLGCLFAILGCAGCADRLDYLGRVGRLIDPVARGLEEYGTISVSSPLLTEPIDYFEFNLNRSPADYYTDAKSGVQGAAALSVQTSLDFQGALRLRADIDALLKNLAALDAYNDDLSRFRRAQAIQEVSSAVNALGTFANLQKGLAQSGLDTLVSAEQERRDRETRGEPEPEPEPAEIINKRKEVADLARLESQINALATWAESYRSALSAPATRPAFPELGGTPPTIDEGLLPTTRPAQAVLPSSTFTQPFALLSGIEETISDRAAIMIADGDFKTQALLRFLSKPDARQFKDKIVLLGVSMVSIAPGNRTYRGFAGEVAVTVDFDFVPARKNLKDNDRVRADKKSARQPGPAPLVAAVSPMTESQTLDLQSSIREQRAAALRLALALQGLGAKAEAEAFLDYVKRLEQDVATRNAANFVTSFSQSGGIFGYHVAPRLTALSDPSAKKAKPDMLLERQTFPVLIILGIDKEDLQIYERVLACGCTDKLEPVLKFRQTTRWIPLGDPTQDPKWFGRFFDQLSKRRLSETERMDWMRRVTEAYEEANGPGVIQHACIHERQLRIIGDFRKDDEVQVRVDAWKPESEKCCEKAKAWGPGFAQVNLSQMPCQNQMIAIRIKPGGRCSWLQRQHDHDSRWQLFRLVSPGDGDRALEEVRKGTSPEDAPRAFADNRIRVLDYGGLDSWSYQSLPESLFHRVCCKKPEDPAKVPSVFAVAPAELLSGRKNTVTLMGRNLNTTMARNWTPLGIPTKQFKVRACTSDTVRLSFKTDIGASGSIYFQGTYKVGKDTAVVTSAPIRILTPTRQPKTIEISRIRRDDEDRLVFPADAPADVVRRFIELPPASRPHNEETHVDIDVTVEDSGNTQRSRE